MRIKVVGGTAPDGESLCRTCRKATIVKGVTPSQELVRCGQLSEWQPYFVEWPVSQCTSYDDKRTPGLYEMEDIAWIIRTKKVGKPAGFAPEVEVKQTEIVITEPKEDRNSPLDEGE